MGGKSPEVFAAMAVVRGAARWGARIEADPTSLASAREVEPIKPSMSATCIQRRTAIDA
jgi:hypothetical protein